MIYACIYMYVCKYDFESNIAKNRKRKKISIKLT